MTDKAQKLTPDEVENRLISIAQAIPRFSDANDDVVAIRRHIRTVEQDRDKANQLLCDAARAIPEIAGPVHERIRAIRLHLSEQVQATESKLAQAKAHIRALEQQIAQILRLESGDDDGEWFIPMEPGPFGPFPFLKAVQEFMNFIDREFAKADNRAEAAEQAAEGLRKQAGIDIGNLLAELQAHQELTGEFLEEDDAAVVDEIKQRWVALAQPKEGKP